MRLMVNGREMDVQPETTVAALVAAFKFQPRHVAVEVNQELVSRGNFETAALHEGDRVEIVTLVGGG